MTPKNISQEKMQAYHKETNNERCPRCGKNILVNDEDIGEVVCRTCGFVMSEKNTSVDSEDYFFDDHVDKRRTGDTVTLARHDMGLSTVINSKNKDAMGKPIATNMIKTIERLRRWDIRTHNEPAQKNLRFAFGELVRMKDKLGLPESVVEKAAYLYRKALEKRLTRGRTTSSIIAAALYMACRDAQTLRTINDFVSTTNIRKKQLTKCYRLLITELGMVLPAIDPVRCVSRIANNLNMSEKTKRLAIEILKKAYQEKISIGKDPMSVAASAMYLSCVQTGEPYTQRHIARVANITEVTIRSRCKELKNHVKF